MPSIVIGLWKADTNSDKRMDDELHELALKAVPQIREKSYGAEREKEGATAVLEYGIAFCGKEACVVYAEESDKGFE